VDDERRDPVGRARTLGIPVGFRAGTTDVRIGREWIKLPPPVYRAVNQATWTDGAQAGNRILTAYLLRRRPPKRPGADREYRMIRRVFCRLHAPRRRADGARRGSRPRERRGRGPRTSRGSPARPDDEPDPLTRLGARR
jgi:hypothetical protein